MCDKEYSVMFDKSECMILKPGFEVPKDWILMRAPRTNDTYQINMSVGKTTSSVATCLLTKATALDSIFWHKKLGHISYHDYMPCKKGKQQRKSHKPKLQNFIDTPLELLHMDLFGPISIRSIGGKLYCLVATDDFSRFSWVHFLGTKDETADVLQYLILSLESLCKLKVRRIRSHNGTEFKNNLLELFCLKKGIRHEFSAPYTPLQNGVAERKNRTLIETERTMLSDAKLPATFWAEAVNTACHVLNRVLVVKRHNKTCYELIKNRLPNLDYLVPFGSTCSLLLQYKDRKFKFHEKAVEEKKVYDREKKAHGSITMALTRELFHSFRGYDNSKDLWKALQKRFEGSSDIKKSKMDLLTKQYECFRFLENESIDELISRFYHLQTELKAFELKYPNEELVEKFLDALPPKFEMYTTLMRENSKFYEMTIDEAIGKVQAHDINLKRKESPGRPQIQDPSMYHGTSSPTKSSGSGIALFSGNSHEEETVKACGGHACYAVSGSGSHHQHPSRNPTSTSSANQTAIAKIAEDHVALFSSCMLAYGNFIGGKLTDPETIEEDFNQVDPDDMEDMDIHWNMTMILRRAKCFLNRTGRKFIGGHSNAKGFHLEDAIIAQTQVGLMAEIMEMMECEEREASVADREESTTAVSFMAIREASHSSNELKCINEKLKNSHFVVEHYESVVRQMNGLGLGTNAIPPPVSGKFINGLVDIDLTCLDESSSQDYSSKKDDSSSKADSASNEEFCTASNDGSVNTCSEGVVSEELLCEQKVKKNIITNSDNGILTEPDIIASNDKLKLMLYGGYKNLNQVKKEAFSAHYGLVYKENLQKYYTPKNQSLSGETPVHKPTPPTHHAESSNARSNETYRRTYTN
ncbi:hypothetical protein L1987_27551 [Smallanthus sonchifolius]|uniref:Uncharacterized protein n=1 Tax=Smallanthus sonchifolius TaxID=185202 RepID=A0ACB9ICQ1_9ASTR|nr:hypothetical protein L1987_27551 [Smallanthus sonchifolius]